MPSIDQPAVELIAPYNGDAVVVVFVTIQIFGW
jgi:hypothetical protein